MALEEHVTKSEKKLLKQIRGYTQEECINTWEKVKGRILNKFPGGFWQNYNHRTYVVEAFVKNYQKDNPGKYPMRNDFIENKLSGLLVLYSSSPIRVFEEAGFTRKESENYDPILAEAPWSVLTQLPLGYWQKSANIKKAVDWLAKKTNKKAIELLSEDFKNNDLFGLIGTYSSPVQIIRKAGYEIAEIDREFVPSGNGGCWANKENRVNATKNLVEKLNKPVTEVVKKDFIDEGLLGLIRHTNNSHITALKEAGYEFSVKDLSRLPNEYWANEENRIGAVRDLVEKLHKPIEEIMFKDFRDAGLDCLINHTPNNSYVEALNEAGYDISILDKPRVPNDYWADKNNRIQAIKDFVKGLGKPVEEVNSYDFREGRIGGLFAEYYGSKYKDALREAGLLPEIKSDGVIA